MTHANGTYWDAYFAGLRSAGEDLDWGGLWTDAFVPLLRKHRATRVLELGCGTGHDAARLASEGFSVAAADISSEAIEQARRLYGEVVEWSVADMTERLPAADHSFDAVMANQALHMFSDEATRGVFAEIRRVTKPGGFVFFHVNAETDRALRAARRPVVREIEPGYVLEEDGRTIRFFSREYILALLEQWDVVVLEPIEIADDRGQPFKHVWRVAARRMDAPS